MGRAIATLAGHGLAEATLATLQRTLLAVPARLARSARRYHLHLPTGWPWQTALTWLQAAASTPSPHHLTDAHPPTAHHPKDPEHTPAGPRTPTTRKPVTQDQLSLIKYSVVHPGSGVDLPETGSTYAAVSGSWNQTAYKACPAGTPDSSHTTWVGSEAEQAFSGQAPSCSGTPTTTAVTGRTAWCSPSTRRSAVTRRRASA